MLGCGVEISNKHNKDLSAFNLENLRWNKIIICTDADVDGFQIRTLILAMIYRLTPTLIEKGFCIYCRVSAFRDYVQAEGQECAGADTVRFQ